MNNDLLAQLQAAANDEEREWLVLQFSLSNLPPATREAAWAAAIPHWFDRAFLAALLPADADPAVFDRLVGLSFVESFPVRGYNMHERSRARLLAHLWQTDPARYRQLSRRAAAYCAQQDPTAPAWRVEMVYHLLLADPDEGATEFNSTCINWHNPPNFAYDKVELLARAAREHAQAGRLAERGLAWTLFWEALLDYDYSRFAAARSKFEQIHVTPELDPSLTSETAFRLGKVYAILSENDAARQSYEAALSLYQAIGEKMGEANCIKSLGDVHTALSELPQARARYEAALPLYQAIGDKLGEANCIKSLGDVHTALSELPQARARYEAALPLYQAIGDKLGEANCIQSLGDVHTRLSELPQARARYEQALPLYQAIGDKLGEANCIRSLGDVHTRLSELPQARARYEQALPLYQAIGDKLGEANCIQSLGKIAGLEQNEQTALEQFNLAAQKYRAFGDTWSEANVQDNIGVMYKNHHNYNQALTAFETAINLFANEAKWWLNRAALYIKTPNAINAAADIEQAAQLQPDNAYLFLRRGQLALLQGHYNEAVTHFQAALVRYPRMNNAYFGLGLAYLHLGQLEPALDFYRQGLAVTNAPSELDDALDDLAANPPSGADEARQLMEVWKKARG